MGLFVHLNFNLFSIFSKNLLQMFWPIYVLDYGMCKLHFLTVLLSFLTLWKWQWMWWWFHCQWLNVQHFNILPSSQHFFFFFFQYFAFLLFSLYALTFLCFLFPYYSLQFLYCVFHIHALWTPKLWKNTKLFATNENNFNSYLVYFCPSTSHLSHLFFGLPTVF